MNERSDWPEWWNWELDLIDHLYERMIDRDFNETDIREMIQEAAACVPNEQYPGRWLLRTTWHGTPWEISVEPDYEEQLLVVITAYPVE